MSSPAEAVFPQSEAVFPQTAQPVAISRPSGAAFWMISLRPLKLGLGLTALLAGVYAVMADHNYVTSNTAVVSGYVTSIRVPIDGTLDFSHLRAGADVRQGQVLASVHNSLFDQRHLYDLTEQRNAAESAVRAATEQSRSLLEQRAMLQGRASEHKHAVAVRIARQSAEAERLFGAKRAELAQAELDLRRGEGLHAAGIISQSDYEKLLTQREISRENAAAAEAALTTLHVEAEAAADGVMSEPGVNNDVAYSQQRVDEINLRLADTSRTLQNYTSEAHEAGANLLADTQMVARMQHAELTSPLNGRVWSLGAAHGERVATGETIAELVDCREAFVLAPIPQDRVPEIEIGSIARFRLSGEREERQGTVASISASPSGDDLRKLAALPLHADDAKTVTVRIDLPAGAAPGTCDIGRTAKVSIPVARGSSLLSHMR